MKLLERVQFPSQDFSGEIQDVINGLTQQSRQWHEWLVGAHDHMLDHEFFYLNSRKERFKQPVYQVILHVFNHGTYHRGQLVSILRQLGISDIPQTDFIVWSRKK